MALSHACVRAIVSSSRSTRLKPSWPPSVVATRFATGMKADDAGILSSARLRFATRSSSLFLDVRVCGLLHLARRRRLQLLALALGRGDTILDGLADRVVGVGHHLACSLCRILGPLHRLASRE